VAEPPEPPERVPYRSIADLIGAHAGRARDRVCLLSIDQGSTLTWGQLRGLTNRLAAYLSEKGIGANDRVCVLTDNSLENLVLYYGVQRHGATYCTVNADINAAHLGEMLRRLAPKLVLWHDALDVAAVRAGAPGEWVPFGTCDPAGGGARDGGLFEALARYPAVPALPPVGGPDDISCICFTSGTSDRPKGVMQSFANYHCIAEQTAYLWGLTPADRVLEYRSFSWSSSHQVVLHPLLVGGGSVAFARRFSHRRFFDWVRDFKPTISIGIPTVVNMLLDRPVSVSRSELVGLRFMSCSTSPLMDEQHRRFEKMYGIPLVQHYGMSEGGTVAGNHHLARRIGSVGRPGLFQNLRIVDEAGNDLPAGEVGEIEIGGPQNATAYLNPDGSVEPVRGRRLKTGDLGCLDADGYLYVTGRAKEIIIRGGVNIAPLEIDGAVMRHPDVLEAATIGVPDPIYGEAIVCYVAARPGARLTVEEVRAHCAAALPEFKRPREIVMIGAVLRNARGKVDRAALAEAWKRDHPA
jgi:acyl-CoA synthetase (AMP-forming)/AMP-acid ligase II